MSGNKGKVKRNEAQGDPQVRRGKRGDAQKIKEEKEGGRKKSLRGGTIKVVKAK